MLPCTSWKCEAMSSISIPLARSFLITLVLVFLAGLILSPAGLSFGAERGPGAPERAIHGSGGPLTTSWKTEPTFKANWVGFPQITLRMKLIASEPITVGSDTFQITEDGTRIEGFSLASATPRSYLVLLLDRSSSVGPVVGDIKRSAARFVFSLPADARISLMSFGSDTDINCDFTTEKSALVEGIKGLRAWGGTAFYDALYLACEQLYASSDPRDLRTVVLFTDGRDETPALRTRMSIKSLDDVLKLAERNNIRLITVGMGTDIDREVLQRMAQETGGWECYAPTAKELSGIYQSISRQIQMERHFILHYMTPQTVRDGSSRKVEIKARLPAETVSGIATYEAPTGRKGIGSAPRPGSAGIDIAPPDLIPATTATPPETPEPAAPPERTKGPKILE